MSVSRASQPHTQTQIALFLISGVTAAVATLFYFLKHETGPSEIAAAGIITTSPGPPVQWMRESEHQQTPSHLICLRSFEISYLTFNTKLVWCLARAGFSSRFGECGRDLYRFVCLQTEQKPYSIDRFCCAQRAFRCVLCVYVCWCRAFVSVSRDGERQGGLQRMRGEHIMRNKR